MRRGWGERVDGGDDFVVEPEPGLSAVVDREQSEGDLISALLSIDRSREEESRRTPERKQNKQQGDRANEGEA